jgi:hypothetical protein
MAAVNAEGGGGLGLATDEGGIPGFTMAGCANGVGVAVGRAAGAGAGAVGAAVVGIAAGIGVAAGAGVAAEGDGRRGRAGLEAAGFSGASLDAVLAAGSVGLPALELDISVGGVVAPEDGLGGGTGAAPVEAGTGRDSPAVPGGNTALTSFGDGAAAAAPESLDVGEPVASVGRRGGRRRRDGGGLCAFGGSAILGSTPLFRHIKGIPDLGAILPSA